ncbi:TetR/AcrR family transcriptional regulator [Spirillospora sp. NPDC050679]
MASLREAQKEMTRRMLLDAGLELFAGKGYLATTVEDIASAVGTTRVTFYSHFPSKAELVKALVAERLNEVLRRSRSPEHGSTAHDLVAAVRDGGREALATWLGQAAERWPEIHPIVRIGRDAAVAEPELRNLVERWLEEAIADIEDGLAAAGRFEPHQRHFRGVLAMAQLDYVAQNWAASDWKLDREQMLAELADSWFGLIGDR